MAGLVPAIDVSPGLKTWMPGTKLGVTIGGVVKHEIY